MPRYTVTARGREFDIRVEYSPDHLEVEVNGQSRRVEAHKLRDTRWLLLIDNLSFEADVRRDGGGAGSGERIVFTRGLDIPLVIEDYALAQMRKAAGISGPLRSEASFKAPMPGLVAQIRVEIGQEISAGDPLIVIEAMKMENVLKARTAGKVKAIPVAVGQSVEKGNTLVEFE